jgi:cell division septation protein DedD
MKKIALIMCILLLVWCGKKQTTVQTEGLEEVIVFGDEENVSTEPVLPATPTEEAVMPEVEPVLPPPLEEEIVSPPFEEEPIMPTEEIAIAPPVVEEEPLLPVLPVEETPPPVVRETYTPPVTTSPPVAPSRAPASVLGFRVQIFASSTENNADRVAADARSAFKNRVYVDYIAPYYKVRVGDCLTREEAEVMKNKARTLGYRGAFVIETMISP